MASCVRSKDCIKTPFSKECRNFCIEATLRIASPDEKRLILRFENATANAIYAVYKEYPIANYDDLARHLTSDQLSEIDMIFTAITQSQLDHFQLDSRQRQKVIDDIKGRGPDKGYESQNSLTR
jgi:hypothetical protein